MVTVTFYIPVSNVWVIQFLHHIPVSIWWCCYFYFSDSDRCVLITHFNFNLHLPDCWRSCAICHLYILFGEVSLLWFFFLILYFFRSVLGLQQNQEAGMALSHVFCRYTCIASSIIICQNCTFFYPGWTYIETS